jgi:hypothetical protein
MCQLMDLEEGGVHIAWVGSKSVTLGIYYNGKSKYDLTVYSPKVPDQGESMGPLEEWPGLPYMIFSDDGGRLTAAGIAKS